MIPELLAIFVPVAQVLLGAVVGALAGEGTARRRAAWGLAAVIGLMPWLVPAELRVERTISALFALLVAMKLVDLMRERPVRDLAARVAHVLIAPDLRTGRPAPPAFNAWAFGTGLLAFAAMFTAIEAVDHLPGVLPLRWLLGAAGVVLLAEGTDRLIQGLFRLGGLQLPPLQNAPVMSVTVAEFWGHRWNALVRAWLAAVCFRPLARRRRPLAGLALAFFGSAGIHWYLALPAVGLFWASLMGGFFLVQGGIVLLERRLGVASWPVPASRAWTITMMLGTAPMFVEPVLIALGYAPVWG